jgi:hypothetical protein
MLAKIIKCMIALGFIMIALNLVEHHWVESFQILSSIIFLWVVLRLNKVCDQ